MGLLNRGSVVLMLVALVLVAFVAASVATFDTRAQEQDPANPDTEPKGGTPANLDTEPKGGTPANLDTEPKRVTPADVEYPPPPPDRDKDHRKKHHKKHHSGGGGGKGGGGGGGGHSSNLEIGDTENESGDIETENSFSIEGDNNSACLGQQQFGQTGNFTNQQAAQQDFSGADDLEFGGPEIEFGPESETACEQAVQQSSAASSFAP